MPVLVLEEYLGCEESETRQSPFMGQYCADPLNELRMSPCHISPRPQFSQSCARRANFGREKTCANV